ncbi:MAG TPA: poly(A) polymerase [Planctomycetes bacterium]|nr:poly(A) polymerase [Planctomycetota bacterium]
MSALLEPVPQPPAWSPDPAALWERYPWLARLDECPQDAVFHAEGDVGRHTRMVIAALAELPAWRALEPAARAELFAAALLHDVAKPDVTEVLPDGHVSSKGHAKKGARRARRILWELGADWQARERISALVEHHLLPFVAIERERGERDLLRASLGAPLSWLAILAEADARGRICADQAQILERIELFVAWAEELGCLDAPYAFPSQQARFLYFRSTERSRLAPGYDDSRGEAVVLCGLPAAGKSSWAREHAGDWPVIALDALRAELGVDPSKNQGKVVAAAREQARVYLRAGQPFVWDGTNLTRSLRRQVIGLCTDYSFRVRLVWVEPPSLSELRARNAARKRPVPVQVVERLLDKLEFPGAQEAQVLEVYQSP